MKRLLMIGFMLLVLSGCNNANQVAKVELTDNNELENSFDEEDKKEVNDSSGTTEEPVQEESDELHKQAIITVGVDTLNVRANPDTESETVGQVHYGDQLTKIEKIIIEDDFWYQMSFGDISGFVYGIYVKDPEEGRFRLLYDENKELLGYYSENDFEIKEATNILRVKRNKLYQMVEIIINDKKAYYWYEQLPQDDKYALDGTFVLHHGDYTLDITEGLLFSVHQLKDVLIFEEHLSSEVSKSYIIYEDHKVAVGSDYSISQEQALFAFKHAQDQDILYVYDFNMLTQHMFFYPDKIESYTFDDGDLRVNLGYDRQVISKLEEKNWVIEEIKIDSWYDHVQVYSSPIETNEAQQVVLNGKVDLYDQVTGGLVKTIESFEKMDVLDQKDYDGNKWYQIFYDGVLYWVSQTQALAYKEIHTVDEFVYALESYTYLKLMPEMAKEDMTIPTIENLSYLVIDGDIKNPLKYVSTTLFSVLTFDNCNHVTIKGIDIGHITEVYCSGSVIEVYNCDQFKIEDSILFGSGFIGLYISESNVEMNRSRIWDCSNSAFTIDEKTSLIVNESVIDHVPVLFGNTQVYDTQKQVKFTDSVIVTAFSSSTYYDDMYWIEGPSFFKYNTNYFNVALENTIFRPSINEAFDLEDIQNQIPVSMAGLSRYGYYKDSDGLVFLQLRMDGSQLEERSENSVENIVKTFVENYEGPIDNLQGQVVTLNDKEAVFEFDVNSMTLSSFDVYYDFTEDYFKIPSKGINEILGFEIDLNRLQQSEIVLSAYPSKLEEGVLKHQFLLDSIDPRGDLPYYRSTPLIVTYDQTNDIHEYLINNKKYQNISQDSLEVKKMFRQLENVFKSFDEAHEYIQDSSSYRYEFSPIEAKYIQGTLEDCLSNELLEELYRAYNLKRDGRNFTSNQFVRGYPLKFSGMEFIFDEGDSMVAYCFDEYHVNGLALTVSKENDAYKIIAMEKTENKELKEEWNQRSSLRKNMYTLD